MYEFLMETDSDEDNEIQDLEQLNAVLIDDGPPSASASHCSMSYSVCTGDYEEYSKIEAALALNKMCDDKLKRLEKILQNRLRECWDKLNEIKNLDKDLSDRQDRQEVFRYVNCGKPYFKDRCFFPAPDNEDTILMVKSGMYDFSNIASIAGWTVKDKSQFLVVLQKLSQTLKKNEIKSKIAELKRESKVNETKKNVRMIAALNRDMDRINKMALKDLALPIDQEYDWDFVAHKLNFRHSAQEYRSLWKLFLHPSINKSPWNKTEHTLLQKIVIEENLVNWDTIALKLGTRRTSYQCFVYFRTNMSNTFTGMKWTKEEEEYLKRLIDYYKHDNYIPWGKVASSMENRTKIQIYNKFLRLEEHRKGRFMPEEDAVILTGVDSFGQDYKKISKYLPGRSAAQIRVRYQVLAKKRISAVWTVDEDRKLVQLMANQDSNINYSTLVPYFEGKDRFHLRSRYLTLTKWMRLHPNQDIALAPRRGARRLGHGQSSDDLNSAIESLKTKIQSELTDNKKKKVTKDSPENVIEDAIIATLLTENARLEEARKGHTSYDTQNSNEQRNRTSNDYNLSSLKKVLILLRSQLNKKKFIQKGDPRYKGLIESENDIYSVRVKSYSKENIKKNNVNANSKPDIWGEVCLGPLEHVFPPHYATITGCRKLMSYLSSKPNRDDTFNLQKILRKNVILKEQLLLLMERFNALFLWPLLLSNTLPEPFASIENDKSLIEKDIKIFEDDKS
ncbi:unnamed protein product [Danaus chrysippus]|uniref:(African queen) hypothetical protein n=1 Tax=Danaus chrysippus TaxID=151541 RepID=A0A8J2QRS5_9NEOP|nr:unnamed protein product [Danaus chrysippus]